ncbi:hypothetical protein EON77_20925, partial [bacterium]
MTDPKQLHAFADGELTPIEANALRETLKADPSAAAEVDAVLNLKDFLAKNSVRHTDDEVWKGCLRRLDGIDKTRRVEGFVGRYAWALCGALFLFILSGRAAMRNVQGDSARTADLARVFGGSAAPVTAQNRAQSKLYAQILGEVGRNLDPSEIEIGVPTRGMVHDFPAAQVAMRDRRGDLVLTRIGGMLNIQDTAPMAANPDLAVGVVDGENCVVWHRNGETWVVNGRRSVEALGAVAARL